SAAVSPPEDPPEHAVSGRSERTTRRQARGVAAAHGCVGRRAGRARTEAIMRAFSSTGRIPPSGRGARYPVSPKRASEINRATERARRRARGSGRRRDELVVLDAEVLEARLVALADPGDRELVAWRVVGVGGIAAVVDRLVLLAGEVDRTGEGPVEVDAARRLLPGRRRADRDRVGGVAAPVPDH